MRMFLSAIVLIVMSTNCSTKTQPDNSALTFSAKKIGELPAVVPNEKNKGVASAFSGIVHNKLVVAGGSFFPDKKPWEGGIKKYENKIYAFDLKKDTAKAIPVSSKLAESVAYGASITLPEGILCLGGNDLNRCTSKVFMIKWNDSDNAPYFEEYPELPVPISYISAALCDQIIYVAGGSTTPDGKETNNRFFSLDLRKIKTAEFKWEILPPYPGIGRILSVMVTQSNGKHNCIYLFSGRNVSNPDKMVVLNDGLMYDPATREWSQVEAEPASSFPVMAGSAFPFENDKIVFVGGAPDSTFYKEVRLKNELAYAVKMQNLEMRDRITASLLRFYDSHQGFSQQIFIYNTVKKRTTSAGSFHTLCPVTTNANPFGDGAIMAGGEIKPGIRTPDIFTIQLTH